MQPKTVSGIRESIELKDYKLAETEVPKVAKAVSDEAQFVDGMATELEKLACTRSVGWDLILRPNSRMKMREGLPPPSSAPASEKATSY